MESTHVCFHGRMDFPPSFCRFACCLCWREAVEWICSHCCCCGRDEHSFHSHLIESHSRASLHSLYSHLTPLYWVVFALSSWWVELHANAKNTFAHQQKHNRFIVALNSAEFLVLFVSSLTFCQPKLQIYESLFTDKNKHRIPFIFRRRIFTKHIWVFLLQTITSLWCNSCYAKVPHSPYSRFHTTCISSNNDLGLFYYFQQLVGCI